MTGSRPHRTRLSALRPASFGIAPTGERLARMRRSPQFVDGQFRNPVPTRQLLHGSALPMARTQLSREGRLRRAPEVLRGAGLPFCRVGLRCGAQPAAAVTTSRSLPSKQVLVPVWQAAPT